MKYQEKVLRALCILTVILFRGVSIGLLLADQITSYQAIVAG